MMSCKIADADMSAAEEARATFDSRWQRMLRRRGPSAEFVF